MPCSSCALGFPLRHLASDDGPCRSCHQHHAERVERLIAMPASPEADTLAAEIVAFEAETCPVPDVAPVTVILAVMRDRGLRQRDVAHLFGGKSRASEVLSGKRQLSKRMIRKISAELGIPAAALLQESPTPQAPAGAASHSGLVQSGRVLGGECYATCVRLTVWEQTGCKAGAVPCAECKRKGR